MAMDFLEALSDTKLYKDSGEESIWIDQVTADKQKYFYNGATGTVLWGQPANRWHVARLINKDGTRSREYYFNPATQTAQWAVPIGYDSRSESKNSGPLDNRTVKEANKFVPAYDPSRGTHYWYNPVKRRRTWTKPEDCDHQLADRPSDYGTTQLKVRQKHLKEQWFMKRAESLRLESNLQQLESTFKSRERQLQLLRDGKNDTGKVNVHLEKGRFEEALKKRLTPPNKQNSRENVPLNKVAYLKSVPLFFSLEEEQFFLLTKKLSVETFEKGSVIVKQGEDGDKFYIIVEGMVSVFVETKAVAGEAGRKKVNELISGDYFGERALMTQQARNATVEAVGKVTCFTLDRSVFNQVLENSSAEATPELSNATSYAVQDMMNSEVASLSQHLSNFDTLLDMQEAATTNREKEVARSLMKLMTSFSPELNVDDTIERMIKTVYGIFRCERVSLYYVDYAKKEMTMKITKDNFGSVITFPIGKGIAGHCAAINKIVNVSDVKKSPYHNPQLDEKSGFRTRNSLCCPIIAPGGSEVIAVIQVINKHGGAPFSEQDEHVAACVSEQMSLTLIQKKTEMLTGSGDAVNTQALWKMHTHFSLSVATFAGADLSSVASEHIIVTCTLYHGGLPLAPPWFVQQKAEQTDPVLLAKFYQEIVLYIKLRDLPRATRVIFNVLYANPDAQDAAFSRLKDSNILEPASVSQSQQSSRVGKSELKELKKESRRGKGSNSRKESRAVSGKKTRRFLGSQAASKNQTGTKISRRETLSKEKPSRRRIEKKGSTASNNESGTIKSLPVTASQKKLPQKRRGKKTNIPSVIPRTEEAFECMLAEAEPIGWAGCNLFDFDQLYRTGTMKLKLFPGFCTPAIAETSPLLSNIGNGGVDNVLEVVWPDYEKRIVYTDYDMNIEYAEHVKHQDSNKKQARSKLMYEQFRIELESFIHKDPLYELTLDNMQMLTQSIDLIRDDPGALSKYIRSIKWNDRKQVLMLYRMLERWETPGVVDALQLLDARFPDPKVRALAVASLENLDDAELQLYLLQLTQVLKHEIFVDCALGRFLLRRAIQSPETTGQMLFWFLKAEMHDQKIKTRYGVYLDLFLRHCSDYRIELGHQMFILDKLVSISKKVKIAKKSNNRTNHLTEVLRSELRKIIFPPKFRLPLQGDTWYRGVIQNECKVFSSKKAPLLLVFESFDDRDVTKQVMFKAGDDLRQDQLTLQVLRIMDKLWKEQGMDMKMSTYSTIATGDLTGFIEIVPNSETLAKITAGGDEEGTKKKKKGKKGLIGRIQAARGVFDDKKLKSWLYSQNQVSKKEIERNFVASCAGYCVATFVLGIGDRHNDNIMLTRDGKFFHIDFGHFLGHFKSKFGIEREGFLKDGFLFTPAMATVIGKKTERYAEFEETCTKAYNILRQNANLLITMFSLMLSCGIAELQTTEDIEWLRGKLLLDMSPEEAGAHFKDRLTKSLESRLAQLNHIIHILVHNKNYGQ